MNFLARIILGPFIRLAANVWCSWQDLKERGEDNEPDFGDHADQAMAVLAGSDLIDAMVPQGTGERCVHDFYEWWDKEKQV